MTSASTCGASIPAICSAVKAFAWAEDRYPIWVVEMWSIWVEVSPGS
jgi:hypothetical protein